MRVALVLVALIVAGCGSSRVGGYGVSFVAPHGWRAQIARGSWTASAPGVRVLLYEDTPDSQWSPPLEFSVYRPGRYFDLFVTGKRAEAMPLIDSLRIEPGDFYPGAAPPARFNAARDWHVVSIGTLPNGTSMFSTTVASTGRYVDGLAEGAPRRTLPRLGPDGIVVEVRLDADNRSPPSPRGTSFHFSRIGPCTVGEGPPLPRAACSGASRVVAREYTAGVVVFYGRAHPTVAQRARADAELARLQLPRWVRW